MSLLRHVKMKTKLLGGFCFVIILSIIVSAIASSAIMTAINVEQHLKDKIIHNQTRIVKLNDRYNAVHGWLHTVQANPNASSVADGRLLVSNLESFLNEISSITPTVHPRREGKIREVSKELVRVINGNFMALLQAGKFEEADKVFLKEVLPYSSEASRLFSDISLAYNEDIKNELENLQLKGELYTVIAITIVGCLIALFLGMTISSYITQHTNRLKEIAAEIAQGNFEAKIRHEIIPNDEIGDIYRSFVEIIKTLNATLARVIAVSNELKSYSFELKDASFSISDGAKKVENQSITVAAAADEMVSTTSDIAKNCHIAQETSEDARIETNVGVEKVRATVARIQEQSLQTQDDASKVLRLAEQSQKIGSIVGTIDEIAAQTNLLALNAAIEAARAGEAGRGFAVVADEVRALALRTSKSTQEITNMVKTVQDDSKAATDSMNSSVSQMEDMANKAGELESTLNHIMNSVNDVNTQIIQISTAAEEQTTATSEISSNMQGITGMAQDTLSVATAAESTAGHAVFLIDRLMEDLKFFNINEKQITTEHDKVKKLAPSTATATLENAISNNDVNPMPN